jgi:hypothetical protein
MIFGVSCRSFTYCRVRARASTGGTKHALEGHNVLCSRSASRTEGKALRIKDAGGPSLMVSNGRKLDFDRQRMSIGADRTRRPSLCFPARQPRHLLAGHVSR